MAKINLLPWRADRRKQREREFYVMLAGAAIAGVLVVLLWSSWMSANIRNQDERNTYLTTQIKLLDDKLVKIKELEKTKSQLLQRKQIIEKLQASRAQMVHLFDELVHTIPDGARLDSMKQDGNTLTLEGKSQSNASVATYMRQLAKSPWLAQPQLKQTEAKGADRRNQYEFGITVKLSSPEEKAKAQEQEDAAHKDDTARSGTASNNAAEAKTPSNPAGKAGGKP
ncbi:MAG TPA: PilN domain-containing protein [Rudaea sp.]|nr:PilN domain-containing protein [Rudaea sp.]